MGLFAFLVGHPDDNVCLGFEVRMIARIKNVLLGLIVGAIE
jgi:hypothetical protein